MGVVHIYIILHYYIRGWDDVHCNVVPRFDIFLLSRGLSQTGGFSINELLMLGQVMSGMKPEKSMIQT
jgi:hypothetical protein